MIVRRVFWRSMIGKAMLVTLATACTSCSTTLSTLESSATTSGGVFRLTEEQADQVVAEAMRRHLGARPIQPVTAPVRGYASRITFGIDHEDILASIHGEFGSYHFSVQASGTMPITGSRTARAVLASIEEVASRYESQNGDLPLASAGNDGDEYVDKLLVDVQIARENFLNAETEHDARKWALYHDMLIGDIERYYAQERDSRDHSESVRRHYLELGELQKERSANAVRSYLELQQGLLSRPSQPRNVGVIPPRIQCSSTSSSGGVVSTTCQKAGVDTGILFGR